MRIVIIGSNGFIGTNLLQFLACRQMEIIACDYRKPKKKIAGIVYCQVSNDIEVYKQIIKENDFVIILKWMGVPVSTEKSENELLQCNIVNIVLLINVCVECKVKKIIFSSSGGAIYGNKETFPIKESEETKPISLYGVHKLMMEEYLEYISRTKEIPAVILRIANPYGPLQKPFSGQGIIATFLASCLLEQSVEIWGDENSLRDYIYIDDVSECFYQCLTKNVKEGIYNVGSNSGTSIRQLCNIISDVTGKNFKKKLKPVRDMQVKNNVLDCSKIADQIGWRCNVILEEGIRNMLDSWNGKDFTG